MAYVPPLNGGRLNASIGGNSTSAGAGYAMLSTGTMYLAGGNNITLSQNGPNITISGANAPSGSVNFSAGTTSANLAAVTFANGNGISFGLNASTITASHNAITSQSVQTQSNIQGVIASGSTNYTGNISFANSNNLTFGLSNNTVTASFSPGTDSIGISTQGGTAGATGFATGSAFQYQLVGGNNVTLSQSLNGASGTLTISAAAQSNQTLGLTATGNTTQNTTATLDARSLVFSGAGNVSVGYTNGSIQISGSGGGGGGGGVALYDGANSITSGTAYLSAGTGPITISNDGQTVNFGVPATSSLVGTGALNIFTNASTISLGVAAPTTLSRWEYPEDIFTTVGAPVQGSVSVQHMYIPFNVVGATAKVAAFVSAASTTAASTGSMNLSLWMGLYTLSGSTLSLASSGSANNATSWQASATNQMTGILGMRQFTVPMAVNITPGEYWMAAMISTATTAPGASLTVYGDNQLPNGAGSAAIAPLGTNTSAARDAVLFEGMYATTTSALPATMQGSQINNTGASMVQRANFYNAIFNTTY